MMRKFTMNRAKQNKNWKVFGTMMNNIENTRTVERNNSVIISTQHPKMNQQNLDHHLNFDFSLIKLCSQKCIQRICIEKIRN